MNVPIFVVDIELLHCLLSDYARALLLLLSGGSVQFWSLRSRELAVRETPNPTAHADASTT